mmetsp:Transcript_80290/g.130110  ORF Transcript_80290/g.130110 Transcript_80290/m.130110 type:complete len:122 (+) Transcript_80290:74-439(+)
MCSFAGVCVFRCVCVFWCSGVGMGVLARAYRFSLVLFYTMVIHVCVFVDVRAVMCAQFCMFPFHTQVCVYAYVCVCVLLCWFCAHRVSMILFYNKVIHVCVCFHVCGRAVFHYSLVQGVCV